MRTRRFPALAAVLLVLCLLVPAAGRGNGWEHAAIPFEALIWGLGEEAAETRARAAESLGFRGQAAAIPFLLETLDRPERDHGVRAALYTALGRLGDPVALPHLHRCLVEEAREELRGACVAALAMIGDAGSLPRLVQAFRTDDHPLVRARVVEALGRFPQEASVELLASVLRHGAEAALRRRAIAALGQTGAEAALAPLVAALAAAKTEAEQAVIVDALGRLGNPDAGLPLRALLEGGGEPVLRSRIVIALASIRDEGAYPALVALLGEESPGVRFYAVRALRSLGKSEATGPLLAFYRGLAPHLNGIEDAETAVAALTALTLQVEVLRALIELDPAAGLPALLAGAQGHDLPRASQTALKLAEGLAERRRVALYGLGYSGADEAEALLAGPQGTGDSDPKLRAAAVRSLGVLGRPGATRLALPLLEDQAPEVRWTAAMVLGRLSEPGAVAPLMARLSDPHGEVRRQAALALGYLGDAEALEALTGLAGNDASRRVREAASYAAGLLQQPN
ncbi:MAG: HEAT repeat domain-containing protein [Rhodospirillales bacterium]|nr:HEAT repeat domain-containing protein [Rhodospirillales bacterium]